MEKVMSVDNRAEKLATIIVKTRETILALEPKDMHPAAQEKLLIEIISGAIVEAFDILLEKRA
jgi:hypothetical protein